MQAFRNLIRAEGRRNDVVCAKAALEKVKDRMK
jgi:hypothetical protein